MRYPTPTYPRQIREYLQCYDKTQVLSLSGSPHPAWQAFLQDQGITHWHDKNSPLPLIYLGYAIVSSPTQRAAHAQQTIAHLRQMCQLYGCRSLSFRGKVTIVNSLIYSKLWHMIRLFSFSQHEMHQLQQLAASFINRNAKVTRFAFDTLITPRTQGGLQLLNPQQQVHALQWRWLHYLLHPSQPLPTHMPSIPILRFTLNYVLSTPQYPSYHWSLLFSSCRPIIPRVHGPVVNLLKALDTIDNDLHHSSVDIPTCLRLPLHALFRTSLPPDHPQLASFMSPLTILQQFPTTRRLYGSDIFSYNSNHLHLEFLQPSHRRPHRTTSNNIIQLIQSNQLFLHNFVLYNFLPLVPRSNITPSQPLDSTNIASLTSLLQSKLAVTFNTETFSYIAAPPTTSGFKSLPSFISPTTNTTILSPSKWKQFWRLRIPINARNTWYRMLHRKITTRQRLHQINPELFTPYCQICKPPPPQRCNAHTGTENNQHFLFSCPKKIQVWATAVVHYIDPSRADFSFLQYYDILKLQPTISRSPTVPFQQLSLYQVFACIIQAIWVAHYQTIFEDIPFVPLTVVHRIHKTLAKLDHEEALHSQT